MSARRQIQRIFNEFRCARGSPAERNDNRKRLFHSRTPMTKMYRHAGPGAQVLTGLYKIAFDKPPVRLETKAGRLAEMQKPVAQFGMVREQSVRERVGVGAAM